MTQPKKPSASDAPAPGDAATETVPIATVSAPIGEGADQHRIVRVGAWQFTAYTRDDEPTIRDVDAATRLGFRQPRDVRKTIERIWPEDKRPAQRATVARRGIHGATQTVNEYWLTEAQLLKVCARSETATAEAILDEMIAVYQLARRGLLPSQRPAIDTAQITAIVSACVKSLTPIMQSMTDRLIMVEASVAKSAEASDRVYLSPDEYERVLARLREVASLYHPGPHGKAWTKKRSKLNSDTMRRMEFAWRSWLRFPRARRDELWDVLDEFLATAKDHAASNAQPVLFDTTARPRLVPNKPTGTGE